MKRYLSALCLSLLAVGAFAAVTASSASAAVDKFTCESTPCIITGTQEGSEAENVFGIKNVAGTTHCQKGTYAGTLKENGETKATVHPTYSECSAFGAAATVDTEGCNFILTGETDKYTNTEGKAEGEDATADLECEANTIKITSSTGCTITFAGQNGKLGVKYTNQVASSETPKNWVTIDVTIDKIKYHTNGAFACAIGGIPKEGETGFLTTKVSVKATKDTGGLNCPKPPDDYSACEGEPTGLTVS